MWICAIVLTFQRKNRNGPQPSRRRLREQRELAGELEYREEDDGGVATSERWTEEVEESHTGLEEVEKEEERSGDDGQDAEEDGERERWQEEEEQRQREEWERRRMEMERGRLGGHIEEEEEEGRATYPSHFYPKVASLASSRSI